MRKLIVCGFIVLSISACARKNAEETSRIQIQTPKSSYSGKMSALANGRIKCYAISVTATDIPAQPAASCQPELGLVGGFVKEGGILELKDVPRGSGRTFTLYSFYQKEGLECPALKPGPIPKDQIKYWYEVGKTENITLSLPEESITIEEKKATQNIAEQLHFPESCLPKDSTAHVPFQISAASGFAGGTGIQLKARVGSVHGVNQEVLSGNGIQLRIK